MLTHSRGEPDLLPLLVLQDWTGYLVCGKRVAPQLVRQLNQAVPRFRAKGLEAAGELKPPIYALAGVH